MKAEIIQNPVVSFIASAACTTGTAMMINSSIHQGYLALPLALSSIVCTIGMFGVVRDLSFFNPRRFTALMVGSTGLAVFDALFARGAGWRGLVSTAILLSAVSATLFAYRKPSFNRKHWMSRAAAGHFQSTTLRSFWNHFRWTSMLKAVRWDHVALTAITAIPLTLQFSGVSSFRMESFNMDYASLATSLIAHLVIGHEIQYVIGMSSYFRRVQNMKDRVCAARELCYPDTNFVAFGILPEHGGLPANEREEAENLLLQKLRRLNPQVEEIAEMPVSNDLDANEEIAREYLDDVSQRFYKL